MSKLSCRHMKKRINQHEDHVAGYPPLAHCRICPNYHAYVNTKQGRGLCTHFMHEMPEDGYCSEHPKLKTKEN